MTSVKEPPRSLLVVAHAPSPNTRRMVRAIVDGAASIETTTVAVRHVPPLEATPADVLGAHALILGTPENLGYMSGALKDFFDRIYYPCLEVTHGRPYALYVRAGTNGTGTLRAVDTIVRGLKWRAVQAPLLCKGPWQDTFVDQCSALGQTMAAGLDADLF